MNPGLSSPGVKRIARVPLLARIRWPSTLGAVSCHTCSKPMPTTVHTDLPPDEHYSELYFARQLVALNLPRTHVWFNVSLPGVGEIDAIILRESGGLFVVEVKSFGINAIESVNLSKLKIRGRNEIIAPHISIDRKMYKLINQVNPQLSRRMPVLVPTVIWSEIMAQEWRARSSSEVSALSRSMLFKDDVSNADKLVSGLCRVAQNPATGTASPSALAPLDDPQLLREFSEALLGGSQPPRARRSDIEKLRLLEAKVALQVLPDVPIDTPSRVLYRGGPGTGKTYRLLQLGVNHCLAERSVLYVCFNKTLASDIGRLFSLVPEIRSALQFPWVFDVADLLKHVSSILNVDLGEARSQDLHDWCRLVQSDLKDSKIIDLATFDLVLVDEVQDMEDWMLEFAFSLLAPSGSIAIAEGIDQQLYGGPGALLRDFEASASRVMLFKNFRNTAPTYRVAADMRRWGKAWTDRDLSSEEESPLPSFDREKGRPPKLELLIDEVIGTNPRTTGVFALERHMTLEYKRRVQIEMQSLFDLCESTDLLILVPQDTSIERRWALGALEDLGVPFIDYTRTRKNSPSWSPFLDDRRRAPVGDMIRLCTYRSSRGLEGTRVLIFGLERSIEIARALETHVDSLLHVVLSRALVDCTVAIPGSAMTHERAALEQAIKRVAKGSGK